MKACSGMTDGMESGGLGGAAMAATLRRQGLAATRRPGVFTAMRLCAPLCCRPMPSPPPAVICPVKVMSANCLNYTQPDHVTILKSVGSCTRRALVWLLAVRVPVTWATAGRGLIHPLSYRSADWSDRESRST